MRYAHARTIQVAPRFGEIRFQTFSLSVNPGSPNAPTHKQADRVSAPSGDGQARMSECARVSLIAANVDRVRQRSYETKAFRTVAAVQVLRP